MGSPIDPKWYYEEARKKFADSPLNGWVPNDGEQFGIKTGSPDEWSRFSTMLMRQESGLRQGRRTPDGGVAKFGTTPQGERSYGPLQFNKGEYGLKTWDDVNDPLRSTDALIEVAKRFGQKSGYIRGPNNSGLNAYFGSIRRPHEVMQHASWADKMGLGANGGPAMKPEDDTFDPGNTNLVTKVRNSLPVTRDENDYITGLASEDPSRASEYRLLQGLQQANRPSDLPDRTWQQFAGQLGVAAGVGISAAHGQDGYAQQGLNQLSGIAKRRADAQSSLDAAMEANRQAINQEGYKVASESLTDKRIKKETARRQIGADLAYSMRKSGSDSPTPEAIEAAAEAAALAGDTEYEKILRRKLQGISSVGAGPTSPTPDQIASEAGGVTGAGFGTVDPSETAVPQAAPGAPAQAPRGMPIPPHIKDAQQEIEAIDEALKTLDKKSDAGRYEMYSERRKALQGNVDAYVDKYGSNAADKVFEDEANSDPTIAGFKDKKQAADVGKSLRGEFINSSEPFKKMSEMYGKIDASRERALAGSPQAQMALIFGFMKLLDPGSTVREGEYAKAADTAGIPQQVWNAYNKALSGQEIGREQVEGFLTEAESAFESQRPAYEQHLNIYRGLANRLGLVGDEVIPDLFPKRTSTDSPNVPDKPPSEMTDEELMKRLRGK